MGDKMIDEEKLEELSRISQGNMGSPDVLYIPDPDTGYMVEVNVNNPSAEAIEVLKKVLGY
jgi:hypothetical protein